MYIYIYTYIVGGLGGDGLEGALGDLVLEVHHDGVHAADGHLRHHVLDGISYRFKYIYIYIVFIYDMYISYVYVYIYI